MNKWISKRINVSRSYQIHFDPSELQYPSRRVRRSELPLEQSKFAKQTE